MNYHAAGFVTCRDIYRSLNGVTYIMFCQFNLWSGIDDQPNFGLFCESRDDFEMGFLH